MTRINVDLSSLHNPSQAAIAAGTILFAGLVVAGCSWREERVTYYPNGRVRERWHERMIGPNRIVKDGKYESFFPDGSTLATGDYNNGDSLGLWEEWYLYGGKRYEKTYSSIAKLKGQATVWMPGGDTLDLRTFNDLGELEGRYVSYWHDTGTMREEGEYKGGKRHGVWERWYRNGQLEHEREYDEGRFVGTWIDYGFDGRVTSRHEFLRELPAELASVWGKALVDGVPTGRSLNFQQRNRRVDTVASEEREYGSLRKIGQDWIVPFKWFSPRFAAYYKPQLDTVFVWRHAPDESHR